MNRVLVGFGKVYPKRFRKSVGKLLVYSGSSSNAENWLGKFFLLNLIPVLALVGMFFYFEILFSSWLLLLTLALAYTVSVEATAYIIPYYSSEKRAKAVEKVLPSFYQLMASYLRSGMTPFQALKSASKKEFGILKDELDIATSKALGTQSFTDAVLVISERINSDNLKRSTELMVRGMDSGGSLAKLLEESAANLIENKSLRRQIIATSRTYTLMVVFAVVIGSPLLLSISTRFNERLIDLTTNIGAGAEDIQGLQLGLLSGTGTIDPQFLMDIAVFTIFITSLISSILVGIIVEGKEKYGLKYAVMFVPASLALFYLFKFFLSSFF